MSTFSTLAPSPHGLASVVFRLPVPLKDGLEALAKRTRVRQSEYLREAIADLLSKYTCDHCEQMGEVRRHPTGTDERIALCVGGCR